MRTLPIFSVFLGVIAVFASLPRVAKTQGVDAESVNEAIDLAVDYLMRGQLPPPNAGWPEVSGYERGASSLVTLALLNAGVSPDHPEMVRALQYISSKELERTYTVSLQTMALCAANPNKYANIIQRNTRWLIRKIQRDGGWNYGGVSETDPSNSQFALLALHEAQRTGLQFPPGTWDDVFAKAQVYWENLQNRDGSFPYRGSRESRGSMTCAGIASLVIAGSQTRGKEASANQSVVCCGGDQQVQDRIDRALTWLGRNFSVQYNPGYPHNFHLYYIYALERVGRLTGQRYIGGHDWYREGAELLISERMQDKGSGRILAKARHGNEYTDTAFALLFLAKGKRQTLVSRMQFESKQSDLDWNHHALAMQHITSHTEQAWKRDLSWQNVDISSASVRELLETPVLFISGTRAPQLTRQDKEKLKQYVEQGGFIFAEGCNGDGCAGTEFEAYFKNLVFELFEQPLTELDPNHPIWYAQARVDPNSLPEDVWIYGVQTCCRLGVVYVPYSLSCRWELNQPYGAKPDYNERVQADLDTATKIGLNVLAYATGKELKEKLDAVTILEDVSKLVPTDRGVFYLPKLKHNAGFDDAAKAVPNLMRWLNSTTRFHMSEERRLISINQRSLQDYAVTFMHGRGKLELNETQRTALGEYLEDGFLFADAICADEEFARSFRQEIELITGKQFEVLPASHPMLTREFYGFNVQEVEVIDPDLSGEQALASTRRQPPLLEVIKIDNRIAVVFSPLDISCALESQHSLQCQGYVREDAARIGMNVVLFALQN